MRESEIQTQILKYLKKSYPKAYIVKLSDKWVSGLPDIMMISDSIAFFFEVKVPKGRPTKIQLYTIKKLLKAGAQASVVRSVNDVKRAIGD